ncbi:HCL492Wp [Eremothecium sinecaudum]|uniref:HCL492Wp n=1 Tax=Eremothecium sinecaudum TaxID=45286 RepID=A0A109UY59_9SACH|nr:HCL492Wp [Eremothecium sinecaudum]AMD19659.1 HCL492Wp [Eremothecium sinecaudum]
MIIVDGDKYSCVACIRGHRSSTCRHTDRMLVKVRTRGRPSPMDIRKVIMVDANSKLATSDADSGEDESSSSGCCSGSVSTAVSGRELCTKMNKQPILFLKALETRKGLLVDGALKIMVEQKGPDSAKKFNFVSEKEFMLKHVDGYSGSDDDACSCKHRAKRQKVSSTENENGCAEKNYTPSSSSNGVLWPDPALAVNGSRPVLHDMVEAFTYKGVYLSTQCSCDDNLCQCANCLIHRKEEELNDFIQQSGIPLTSLGSGSNPHVYPLLDDREGQLTELTQEQQNGRAGSLTSLEHTENGEKHTAKVSSATCKCTPANCICLNCDEHPPEIISMNKILLQGLVNLKLKRKILIQYRGKLFPSKFWWDLLSVRLPSMSSEELESLDLLQWFDNILETHSTGLPSAEAILPELHDMLKDF